MNELIVANVNKYARMLAEKKYLQSGYIAVKQDDGIVITNPKIDYTNVTEDNLTFVNDKNIETLEGNFRAAAVILYCAVRQDKNAGAAAIVDSDSTVAFSSKRKTLMPILDDLAQVCGVSIKCATKNVASDVVAALSGQRNVCLLPDAGAVVTGRTLDEVFTATLVLDKACNAEILSENKGGTQHMSAIAALLEHVFSSSNTQRPINNSKKPPKQASKRRKKKNNPLSSRTMRRESLNKSKTQASDCLKKISFKARGAISPSNLTTPICSQRRPASTISCSSPNKWQKWI